MLRAPPEFEEYDPSATITRSSIYQPVKHKPTPRLDDKREPMDIENWERQRQAKKRRRTEKPPPYYWTLPEHINVNLEGGEGLHPHECYDTECTILQKEQTRQACVWFMMVDICVYDRTDYVEYPEKLVRKYDPELSAWKLKTAVNAKYDSDEDDKFNWLMDYGESTGNREDDMTRRRMNFKTEQLRAKRLRWDQRNLFKQTVEWQSEKQSERQAIKMKFVSVHWNKEQTFAITRPSRPRLRPRDDKLEKMEIERFSWTLNFEEWSSRLSGSIIPFSTAAAATVAVPPTPLLTQDPGLPSGASASAAAAIQDPGLPSGSYASAAPAALPGENTEDSEEDEAKKEPDITGRWVKRAGQEKWRVCSVHLHHEHANKRREHGRETAADIITLALREKCDAVSGDWNQAGGYLEEVVGECVRLYERQNNLAPNTVIWQIPGDPIEIRTVFFNWPINGITYIMDVKEQTICRELSQQYFGLEETDGDAHVPQFYMVSKTIPKVKPTTAPEPATTSKSASSTPQSTPMSTPRSTDTDDPQSTRRLHISSAQGQEREKKRRKDKNREKQQKLAYERDGYSLAKMKAAAKAAQEDAAKAAQEQAKAKVEQAKAELPKPSQSRQTYQPKDFTKQQTPIGAPPPKSEKGKGIGKRYNYSIQERHRKIRTKTMRSC